MTGTLAVQGLAGALTVQGVTRTLAVHGGTGTLVVHGGTGTLAVQVLTGTLTVQGLTKTLAAVHGVTGTLAVQAPTGTLAVQGLTEIPLLSPFTQTIAFHAHTAVPRRCSPLPRGRGVALARCHLSPSPHPGLISLCRPLSKVARRARSVSAIGTT